MPKMINNPQRVVDEMLHGFYKCHSDRIAKTRHPRVFVRRGRKSRTPLVGIVSGGGTGHLPAFIGYVRKGMIDAVAVGNLFEAPSAEVFLEAIRQADQGEGVLCIHGNYPLDNRCVGEAVRLARLEGIRVEHVCANDDVATIAEDGARSASRGLAGEVLLWKIAGAASMAGKSLEEITDLCRRANLNTRSIGVAFAACIRPEVGVPNFEVVEGTMEFGIGHHGDPGLSSYKMRPANEIADLIMEKLLAVYPEGEEASVTVMVSGLGATTQMELYILYNRIADILKARGIRTSQSFVGNYFTSLDMQGVSVTLMKMDEELERLVAVDAESLLG